MLFSGGSKKEPRKEEKKEKKVEKGMVVKIKVHSIHILHPQKVPS